MFWEKLRRYILIFESYRQKIVVSFPAVVCDNVISNDVTITSSLRIDVIILGISFLFS